MPDDFTVTGADDFLRLSKALKAAGETDMRKALHKGLRAAVKPVSERAEQKLREGLPYGTKGKAVTQVVQPRTGRDPGVRVVVRYGSKRASNAQLANAKGIIRHPVFADGGKTRKEWRWVNQDVPELKGWFDRTYTDSAPALLRALHGVLEGVADDIVRRAK